MYFVKQNKILGLFFIFLGLVLLVLVLGHLIGRIILAFVALGLINYGLQMRGMPPLQLLIRAWLSMTGWRNF